jgi:hypothetical protein
MLNKIKEEVLLTQAKMKFIVEMGKFDFRRDTKKKLTKHFLDVMNFRKDHLEKCFAMAITRLNKESLIELKNRLGELKKEWDYYKNTTPKKLYEIDLENMK